MEQRNRGKSAQDPANAASVALALLYRKLGTDGVANPTEAAITSAIDRYGEGDGKYGIAVMKWAKQLDAGNFEGAYDTMWQYANWVEGGSK